MRLLSVTKRARQCRGLAAAVVLVGCGTGQDEVVIGYALPGWGAAAAAVVREELAREPLPGLRVRLAFDTLTTGSPADEHVDGAERLVAVPGLVAVVGHGGSRESLVASPVYNEAEVVQVVPTGTSRLLAGAGPWTFTLAPNDSIEGEFIASYLTERLRARRVAIFYVNDEYGVGLRDGVVAGVSRRDGRVIHQTSVSPDGDLEALVDVMLLRGAPDAVVAATRGGAAGQIARLLRARERRIPVVAGDGALDLPNVAVAAGAADSALRVVAFWTAADTAQASRTFVDRFVRLHGRLPHASHAMAYDALHVLLAAVREVGPAPAAIRAWLVGLGQARPAYVGITGAIDFRPDRAPRFVMVRVIGGVATPIARDDPP